MTWFDAVIAQLQPLYGLEFCFLRQLNILVATTEVMTSLAERAASWLPGERTCTDLTTRWRWWDLLAWLARPTCLLSRQNDVTEPFLEMRHVGCFRVSDSLALLRPLPL